MQATVRSTTDAREHGDRGSHDITKDKLAGIKLMGNRDDDRIHFTLNGQRYELTRHDVDQRLSGVRPDAVHKHAALINGSWFPVMQAFEVATGIPRSEFRSHTARRHLASLRYEVRGEVDSRSAGHARGRTDARSVSRRASTSVVDESWHTEESVQAAVVRALVTRGHRILSVANTATKEHGVDIIASLGTATLGVEVKGFPSRAYADPRRAGETKKTRPSTQAGHWYSQAILAAMRLRGREPEWQSVIALPDFPRYRDLYYETKDSLLAANIAVWWVDQSGEVGEA